MENKQSINYLVYLFFLRMAPPLMDETAPSEYGMQMSTGSQTLVEMSPVGVDVSHFVLCLSVSKSHNNNFFWKTYAAGNTVKHSKVAQTTHL